MIFRTPSPTSTELQIVQEIENLRRVLGYGIRTPSRRWTGLLRRNALAKALQGTNSIEGYNVTVEDAIAAVEGEEPLEASPETRHAVMGYRVAITYVLQLADDPHFTYSPDLLRALHFVIVQHDLAKNPGRWRPGPIFVRDERSGRNVYEGPNAQMVPGLIEELIRDLAEPSTHPPLVRAAMAHLNLVMIHPYSDGNGRMARCLQTLVLARSGTLEPVFCSIEEFLGRNARPYYDVLAEVGAGGWNPDRDARPWIRFCLRATFFQAKTQLYRMTDMSRIWDELESEMSRRHLPERMIAALVDAAMGYRVRHATYRPSAGVSDQVASRDLRILVDEGLLIAQGERRGRQYVASKWLAHLAASLREERIIDDPFPQPKLPGVE